MTVAAILVAGGSGRRLGAEVPKAFVTVDGRSLVEIAAEAVAGHPRVDTAVVVAPAGWLDRAVDVTGLPAVAGGVERQHSVSAGLAAVAEADVVLVHDVARPFVPPQVIDAVLDALEGGADAVVPVVPIHDTVRRVEPDGTLAGVLDRSSLVAIQTPQGFHADVLRDAHAHAAQLLATDDAALVEARGGRVVAVPGADESFKITTSADLARAAAVATGLPSRSTRTGGAP